MRNQYNTIDESSLPTKETESSKKNKKALFVLGMHRSGTSALMRICNILGVELGDKLLPAKADNAAGFWEHEVIVDLHDRLLEQLGSGWDDIDLLPEEWWKHEDILPIIKEIRDVMERDFSQSDFWGLKDPRVARLLPVWLEILREKSVKPYAVFAIRDPFEVALSLQKRDGFSLEKGVMLWIQYVLEAEYYSRSIARSIVCYENLLQNWESEINRCEKELGVAWPVTLQEGKAAIDAYLDPSLRHNRHQQSIGLKNLQIPSWLERCQAGIGKIQAGEEKEGQLILDALREDIKETLEPIHEFLALEYQDIKTIRQDRADIATTLHQRNKEMLQLNKEKLLAEHKVTIANARKELAESALEQVMQSRSWRITAPLRAVIRYMMAENSALNPRTYKKLYALAKNQGIKKIINRFTLIYKDQGVKGVCQLFKRQLHQETAYAAWVRLYDTITPEDRLQIQAHITLFDHQPCISIVMPVYDIGEQWLRDAMDSVCNQLYPHWELCIADDCSPSPHIRKVLDEYAAKDKRIKVAYREKNGHISAASNTALELATGEFVALLDHDDTLPEHALYYIVNEINNHPDVDLIYSDEDKIDPHGNRFGPYFKTDWNPDLFYSQNMFSHLGVYRRSILEKIGGFREGYEGSQDYDLCLRCLPHTASDKIRHIPRILYHWRAIPGSTALNIDSKSYALQAARRAMKDYFTQQYPGVTVVDAEGAAKRFGYHRIIWPIPDPQPKVSIIIPTRNQTTLLQNCISSILEKTAYSNYEIIIVDNQSDDAETLRYMQTLENDHVARVLRYDHPFNFSAINNLAVTYASGELLAFINNDVEVIETGWLTEMVGHALRPDVSVVGAKLLYSNDTVQHAGVYLGVGPSEVAAHTFTKIPGNDQGYYARAVLTHAVSAVTAACMVVRRDVFEEVGGFNEESLKIAYNDVDFCLKTRAKGYWVICTTAIPLYHHESLSRGIDEDSQEKLDRLEEEANYMKQTWGDVLKYDPFYNANLNVLRGDFSLENPPRLGRPWKKIFEDDV